MKRRTFLGAIGAAAAAAQTTNPPESIRNLRPMTAGVQPITAEERRERIENARRLMRENRLAAVLMEGGSSSFYFTGARFRSATGLHALLLPVKGDPVWIVPASAESSAREAVQTGGESRAWKEGADPFGVVVQALKDRGAATGRLGVEEMTRFAVFDALRRLVPSLEFVNATPVTAGCRVIKSPAELVLMQRANDVTIEAYRAGLATLREGMTQGELSANIAAAHRALGFTGSASASFGKYTAFPHGSIEPQKLREGDFVLIDGGCSVEGYQSDITRTVIFGKPTDRQRQIWSLERKAQDAALAAAKPGAACESVDAAARKVITDFGFGPDYKVPGLPHRTGHGIGLDGHEWTNLVRGNKTRLEPGMCFSDEPMIAIYGEFGVRLEDCMYITANGARTFTRQAPAIDQPFG